jgi:adenosylcobalamin-dependent ribonucleoside-triphosphate reductase
MGIQNMPSTRANIITRRTYNRPIDEAAGIFETWQQTIDRVIGHQRWLWRRAKGSPLSKTNEAELEEVRQLMLARKASLSGRTLWLGGTDVSRRREASQFNCSFLCAETVHDVVDTLWLLLQGCGVGALPVAGTLNGFSRPMDLKVIRSERTEKGGQENNVESYDAETRTWTIKVGDSAEAWAKSIGKLLAGKFPARHVVLDFSELRPAGLRLSGYGWISSGDEAISKAFSAICAILSKKAGQLLSGHDIHDILNWLGTILSSRRSSEIMLWVYDTPGWQYFADFKKDMSLHDNGHRQQSNNSLLFRSKPTTEQLQDIFDRMVAAGGSEPGFINGTSALRRAPWFSGVNPCAEILLANKSFCNLVETNVSAFKDDPVGMHRCHTLMARANYRQTCVDLRDGILQSAWHENNEFLRLCGVGVTGVTGRPDMTPYDWSTMKNCGVLGTYSMADELGLPRPKLNTCVKPSGTLSKIMDADGEGAHKPMGRYMFNHIKIGAHDSLVPKLEAANYHIIRSPNETDTDTVLVRFPMKYDDVNFEVVNGVEVNVESAVKQLDRYKMLMDNYVDHNCSVTVSYDEAEVPAIVEWIDHNWDSYVGVSFMPRIDPTVTAKDLGYDYLPQEVVTKARYDLYVKDLLPVDIDSDTGMEMIDEECESGFCPVR